MDSALPPPLITLPHIRPGTQDEMIVKQVLQENQYRLPDAFNADDVIIDVGAHIGSFAAACLARGAGRVICYEPDVDNYATLTRNLATLFPGVGNGPCRWEAHNVALGPPHCTGKQGSFFAKGSTAFNACSFLHEQGSARVELIDLPGVLRDLPAVRLLKIDAEGAEWLSLPHVTWDDLQHVQEVVGESHVPAPEIGGVDHEDLKAYFAPLGFFCEQVPLEESRRPDGKTFINQLFFATRPPARDPNAPLKMLIVRFPYGGSDRSEVGDWVAHTVSWSRDEKRLSLVSMHKINDTPITMTRNLAVKTAQDLGYDLLVMVDNDMTPDCESGAPAFLPVAFDFWYKHAGPCCIGAPYCGPPPDENPYIFRWRNGQNDTPDPEARLTMYTREEAAEMSGVKLCAALPTGLILIDMKAFPLLEQPYFYYEFTDAACTKKASTEDVTFSRDCSFAGVPQYCTWDCWAGHNKNKCVRKPAPVSLPALPRKFCNTIIKEHTRGKTRTPVLFPESCG